MKESFHFEQIITSLHQCFELLVEFWLKMVWWVPELNVVFDILAVNVFEVLVKVFGEIMQRVAQLRDDGLGLDVVQLAVVENAAIGCVGALYAIFAEVDIAFWVNNKCFLNSCVELDSRLAITCRKVWRMSGTHGVVICSSRGEQSDWKQ